MKPQLSQQTIASCSLLIVIIFCLIAPPLQAGVLYNDRELEAVGNLWKQTQCRWEAEQARHIARMEEIDASSVTQKRKDFFHQREINLHRAESQALAARRHQVHNVLIDEANARSGRGQQPVSDRIEASLGTKIDDPAHSGMKSDLDARGGELTSTKVKETLKDMGLDKIPVRDRAGTLEIGTREICGDFELVVHKGGITPEVGTEFHHIRNQVDARNPEIFMSERMKNRAAGTKQVGTDYVEVQDHLKKASHGHNASNQDLIDYPDDLQSMVKSTNKTLDMGDLSPDELKAILRRNSIKETPEEFLKKLSDIKQRRARVTDPAEAGRIREASKDIMAKAEKKTYARAKDEIATKKQQLATAEENLKKVKAMSDNPETTARRNKLQAELEIKASQIRHELIDSSSKMQASKCASDELRPRRPQASLETPDTPTKKAKTKTSAKPKAAKVKDAPSLKTRIKSNAVKVTDGIGGIMDIADIGNACKKLQEYQEGKAKLKDVVRSVVDMTPVGGAIGVGEKIGTSGADYYEAAQRTKKTNEVNMIAYLTQWELALRRADLSKEDARRYVSAAVLSGNLDALDAKAEELRMKGKTIKVPKLVVEDGPAPDGGSWYAWENTKELGKGMYESTYSGIEYIAIAPGTVLVAYAEGQLAEATLDYNSKTAESDMKTRIFRTLLSAGIDSKVALRAVQNGGSDLKNASKEARKYFQEKRDLELKIEAERQAFQQRVDGCLKRISDIRFMPLHFQSNPVSPIPIPQGGSPDDVMELTVSFDDSIAHATGRIRSEIKTLIGQEPKITVEYVCSIKSAKESEPGIWTLQLPVKADLYPVSLTARITITGLTGEYSAMCRTIHRTIRGTVQLKQSTESIVFSKKEYQFYDGDYETITAKVTGAQAGANYFYQWTVGKTSVITQEPAFRYNAELNGANSKTETLTVVLADRLTGSFLDEKSATITTLPLTGIQVLVNEHRTQNTDKKHIWELVTCKDIKIVTREESYQRAKQDEYNKLMMLGTWQRGDYIQGQPRIPKLGWILGLKHGLYTRYDSKTGTMLDQTGHYRNGKKHGKWVSYDTDGEGATGTLSFVVHYVNGEKDGNNKHYIDGWLSSDTNWKNGKQHGTQTYYSKFIPGGIAEYYLKNQGVVVSSFRWTKAERLFVDRSGKTPPRYKTIWTKGILNADGRLSGETYDENFVLIPDNKQ